jgi:hypothetical protein
MHAIPQSLVSSSSILVNMIKPLISHRPILTSSQQVDITCDVPMRQQLRFARTAAHSSFPEPFSTKNTFYTTISMSINIIDAAWHLNEASSPLNHHANVQTLNIGLYNKYKNGET